VNVQSLPGHLIDYILEHLEIVELLHSGRVSREFLASYRRVVGWQRLKWGPNYHEESMKRYWARMTARKEEEFVAENWEVLHRNRSEARRVNDMLMALILTCTGVFFVSCVKHHHSTVIAESRLSNIDFPPSLENMHLLFQLVGPGLVLYAVMLVVFEEALPGSKRQRRNRMLLLLAGLSMSCLDQFLEGNF